MEVNLQGKLEWLLQVLKDHVFNLIQRNKHLLSV